MKKIIVPTDFSKNAQNALNYAINLANHFDSTIYLIHVYEAKRQSGMLVPVRDFMKDEAEQELSQLVSACKAKLLRQTSLEAIAIEGYSINTIIRFAESKNADLIIMGTQGASGLQEVFWGSNTSAVIDQSTCPVLAIPSGFQYELLEQITFAVDDQVVNNLEVLAPIRLLAQTYRADIKLLHVEKGNGFAVIDPGIDKYLEDSPTSFHIINGSNNIEKSINEFVKETEVQLLVLLHRDRGFWGQLLHQSFSKKEAFHSEVPLLILKEKNQ